MLDLPPQDIQMENTPTSHFEHFVATAEETAPAVVDGSVVPEEHTVSVEPSTSTEEPAVVDGSVVPEEHVVAVESSANTEEPAVVDGSVVPEEPTTVATEEAAPVAAPAFTDEELKQEAETLKKVFSDGFQWRDLGAIAGQALDFVIENQHLGPEEIKSNVMTVMNHLIDITDTPYLPDHFTDPMFKAMMPPLIDLLETVLEGKFVMLPTEESEKPTGERLSEFVEKMKVVYADGFTWSDLMVTLKTSVEFMGSFPYLEREEKEKCVVDIVNHIIDETDTPKVPDLFTDRIFKAMVPSFVSEIFKRLP